MSRRSSVAIAVVTIAVIVAALASPTALLPRACAQDATSHEALIAEATDAFGAGAFERSLGLFEQADRMRSTAVTLRGIALCALRLSRPAAAITYAIRALASTDDPLPDDKRGLTEELVANVQPRVARYWLELEPAQARMRVDEAEALRDPRGALWLEPGPHHVRVEADGYVPWTVELIAAAGTSQSMRVQLRPLPAPITAREASQASQASASPPESLGDIEAADAAQARAGSGLPLAPIVLAGAGAAMLIAGAVTGAVTEGKRDELARACAGMDPCSLEFAPLGGEVDDLALVTTVLLGAGVAAVAAGGVWLIATGFGGDDDDESTRARLRFGPGRAAITLEGRM